MRIEQRLLQYFRTYHRETEPTLQRIQRDISMEERTITDKQIRAGLLELLKERYIDLDMYSGRYRLVNYVTPIFQKSKDSKIPIVITLDEEKYRQMRIYAQRKGVSFSNLIENLFAKCITDTIK